MDDFEQVLAGVEMGTLEDGSEVYVCSSQFTVSKEVFLALVGKTEGQVFRTRLV